MLSEKTFRWMHLLALFAVIFASLAPSISHALAAKQGFNSFAQEVCTTDGQTITIQVVTRQGKQMTTELTAGNEAPASISVVQHLNHCPFCANPSVDTFIDAPHAFVVALLTRQAQQVSASTQAVLPRFSVLPPPAQAPPQL